MRPDAEIRTDIDWRKLGAAHTGSPRTNPINAQQAALAAAKGGLTGGIKGALVLDGVFSMPYIAGAFAGGVFTSWAKDTSASFLDTTYFNFDPSTYVITVVKPCYYMVFADGYITLINGLGTNTISNFSLGLGASGKSLVVDQLVMVPTGADPVHGAVGPLMVNGAIGDTIAVLAGTQVVGGYFPSGYNGANDGVARLQIMVVG